jgi:hypothetical protein
MRVAELANADRQRLVAVTGIDPAASGTGSSTRPENRGGTGMATTAVARDSSCLATRLETHPETHVQGRRQPLQHRESRNGPTGLEPSNRGLCHPRRLRQLCRAPTPALTKLPNGTAELERQPRRVVRFSSTRLSHPPLPHRGPTATFAHDLTFLVHDLVCLIDAPRKRPTCPVDLPLVRIRVLRNRQQDDPLVGRDPVGDPDRLPLEVEPQLAQLPIELLRASRLTPG